MCYDQNFVLFLVVYIRIKFIYLHLYSSDEQKYNINKRLKIANFTQKHESMKTKTKKNEEMASLKVAPGRESFSFLRGWNQVIVKDMKNVQNQIMIALNLKGRVSWYNRLYGVVEPKISEHNTIEKIFADYGITDVWGV